MCLRDWLNDRLGQLQREIAEWPETDLLATDIDEAVQYLCGKHGVTCPVLVEDQIDVVTQGEVYQPGRRVDRVVFGVPFTGHPEVFNFRPSTHSSVFPNGTVIAKETGQELHLEWYGANPTAEQLTAGLEKLLAPIRQWLDFAAPQIRDHNVEIEVKARGLVGGRQERGKARLSALDDLGIAIRERPDAARFRVPQQQRALGVPRPKAHDPEPHLEDQDYEAVLNALRNRRSATYSSSRSMPSSAARLPARPSTARARPTSSCARAGATSSSPSARSGADRNRSAARSTSSYATTSYGETPSPR
jgi:hypothetical protein